MKEKKSEWKKKKTKTEWMWIKRWKKKKRKKGRAKEEQKKYEKIFLNKVERKKERMDDPERRNFNKKVEE